MNGLPKNKDLTFLLGKELIQVCVGLHQKIIRFDGETSITLECEYKVLNVEVDEGEVSTSCSGTAKLLKILGSRITGVTNEGSGELSIAFSNGSVLVVYDSNSEYESYQLSDPTQTIVV